MKQFMALLRKNENKDPPQAKLLQLAGKLCGDAQSVSPGLEKLVEAMMRSKLQKYFLTNVNVVKAYVLVLIHHGQHDLACRLLECCKVKEKAELVRLWNEIHYDKDMKKYHTDSLTAVQKFRCRKRNPPPVSLCPEGTTNRNFPEKVRQTLRRFAENVTLNPNMDQRYTLARDMNLKPCQVYYWFANYRRRLRAQVKQMEKLTSSTDEEPSTSQANHQPDSRSCIPQAADAFRAGIGSEWKEIHILKPCGPGWEQSAVGLDYSADGTFLTLLESSFPQSSASQEMSSAKASVTPVNMEEAAAFWTKAEHSVSLSSATMETGQTSSYTATDPRLENFVLCSCGSLPFHIKYLDTGVFSGESNQGPTWSPGTAAGVRASMSRVPGSGCIEASSESISHQADLELQSFMLREGQLGSLEAILPHR
ncbi:anomalous homeobox protein-like [Pangshura tecta]